MPLLAPDIMICPLTTRPEASAAIARVDSDCGFLLLIFHGNLGCWFYSFSFFFFCMIPGDGKEPPKVVDLGFIVKLGECGLNQINSKLISLFNKKADRVASQSHQ